MNKALAVIEEQIAKYELLATQKTKKQSEYLEVAEQLRDVVKNCNLQNVSGSFSFEAKEKNKKVLTLILYEHTDEKEMKIREVDYEYVVEDIIKYFLNYR